MEKANFNKNTFYNVIKTASSIIFPLITFPYVSRVLQPENVGKINFSNSIVSYFMLIATLGVTTYAIRECAKVRDDREKLGRVSGQILSINIITTVIAYILLFIMLMTYNKVHNYRYLICILSITIMCTTIGADWLNSAMEDFKYITIRTLAFQLLSLVLMFVFVRRAEDYVRYAIIMVVASGGANIINVIYRRRYCNTVITAKPNFRKHLPPIIGLFAMLVAQQILTMSDTTIIGVTLGDYEVGLYSTAVKLYNLVLQITASITWVVMPQLSVAYAKDDVEAIKSIYRYVIQFSIIIGVPCIVGILVLAPEFVMIIGGASYIRSAPVLRILAITLTFAIIGNFTLNINLLAAGKDKICLIVCGVASVFNVITNLIFIPQFGINAAAITTIIAQVIMIAMCAPYLDKRLYNMEYVKCITKPVLSGLVLTTVIIGIKVLISNIWICVCVAICIGGVSYVGMLVLLKDEFVVSAINGLVKNKRF